MASVQVVREMVTTQLDHSISFLDDDARRQFRAMRRRIVDAIMDALPICPQPCVAFQGEDCLIYGDQVVGGKLIAGAMVTVVVNRQGVTRSITDYDICRIVNF